MSTIIMLLFIAPFVLLLFFFIRFALISLRTKGAKSRLRHPEPEIIEAICGFPPPQDLLLLYREARMIELVEFYLVDHSQSAPKAWFIGGFNPLAAVDLRAEKIISGVKNGIPIADDMAKGTYLVTRDGSIKLHTPNVKGGEIEVAKSVREFGNFEIQHEPPPGCETEYFQ